MTWHADATLLDNEETRSGFNRLEDQALTDGRSRLGEAERFQRARTARTRSSKTGVDVLPRNSRRESITWLGAIEEL